MRGKARRAGLALGFWAVLLAACGGGGQVVTEGTPDAGPDHDTPVRSTSAVQDFEEAAALWQQPAGRDLEEIADLLESAVDKDAAFAQAWFNLGLVREELGDPQGAEEAYRQSNAADNAYMDGLANIAAMRLKDGQTAQAQQLLEQVVATDQFNAGANLNLARLQRIQALQGGSINRTAADDAINRIRLSLAGDAMNVDAYETLAAVYYDLERYRLAHLVCLNAIALGLHSATLYNRLGLILLAQDDVTGAYAQFRQAVSLDPTLVEASMNLGAVALNYRDYAGALEAFERVLTVEPQNLEAMISRAVSLRGLEDMVAAEQGYQAVLAIEPENLAALYNLGVLYQEYEQDYAAAREWFGRYQAADRSGSSALAADVATRIDLLEQLIELLRDSGGAAPQDGPAPLDEPSADGPAPVDEAPPEGGTPDPVE